MGVSDLIASALGAGLEARVAEDTVNGNGGGGGESGGRGSAGVDGRKQVATIRLGGNRFLPLSWQRVLVPLSMHPPRELDLAWASVASRSFIDTTRPTSDEQDSIQSATTAALSMVASAELSHYAGATPTTLPAVSAPAQFSVLAESPPMLSSPQQPLCELLAGTILPMDAPGIETLNLLGSTGLLPVDSNHTHADTVGGGPGAGGTGRGGTEEGERTGTRRNREGDSERLFSSAFLVLLRDGLMSPLCRTTSLLLSGVRGPASSSAPRNVNQNDNDSNEGGWLSNMATGKPSGDGGVGRYRTNAVLGPGDIRSLCYAASACASLRCLDLAGCDLSGALGAGAVTAAVTCLLAHDDDDGHVGDHSSLPYDSESTPRGGRGKGETDASTGTVVGLSRLSLRACHLGAAGLSAALGALVSVVLWGDGAHNSHVHHNDNTYHLRKERLRRFPLLLDLSDNRPAASSSQRRDSVSTPAAGAEGRGRREEWVSGVVEGEDSALVQITESLRELERSGSASVMPFCDSRLSSGRCARS